MRDHENVCLTVAVASPLAGDKSVGAAICAEAQTATAMKDKRIANFFIVYEVLFSAAKIRTFSK